jgi:hypothetical protein
LQLKECSVVVTAAAAVQELDAQTQQVRAASCMSPLSRYEQQRLSYEQRAAAKAKELAESMEAMGHTLQQ